MFDFVNPARPYRWLLGRRWQARLNETRSTPHTRTQHRKQRVEPRSEVHSTGAASKPGDQGELELRPLASCLGAEELADPRFKRRRGYARTSDSEVGFSLALP